VFEAMLNLCAKLLRKSETTGVCAVGKTDLRGGIGLKYGMRMVYIENARIVALKEEGTVAHCTMGNRGTCASLPSLLSPLPLPPIS
jgi:hypothetical protein